MRRKGGFGGLECDIETNTMGAVFGEAQNEGAGAGKAAQGHGDEVEEDALEGGSVEKDASAIGGEFADDMDAAVLESAGEDD